MVGPFVRRNGGVVLLTVLFISCAAHPPVTGRLTPLDKLREEFNYIFSDPSFSNAHWGVAIQSLETGEYFYLRNENKSFMPASNMKLFTTAAALVKLTPEFRYITNLYQNGKLDSNGVLHGDVIIKGSGDPSITGRYHDGHTTRVFEEWADSLWQKGIKTIDGNIVGDDNAFVDEIMGQGWAWDYQSDWYAAQISALSFNDNCVEIIFTPGDSIGAPVKYRLEPDTKYVVINNHVTTIREGLEEEITFNRERCTNLVEITGSLSINREEKRDWFSVENPTLYGATVFKEVLEKRGIQVKGSAFDIDDLAGYSYSPTEANKLASYTSPPLWRIVETVNKVSQNLYAEQLLRTLGLYFKNIGDTKHGVEVLKEFLSDVGIDPRGIKIADGSGLSRYNLVTPRQIITLLRYMKQHPHGTFFYNSLPVAGVDGTLKRRLKGTLAEGGVRARTGYIGGVRALSGYVTTRDGEELVFSMMANNYLVPTSLANSIQDLVCERLAHFSRQ